MFRRTGFVAGFVAGVVTITSIIGSADARPGADSIRIGILATMFRGGKPAYFNALKGPFTAVVKAQTGLDNTLELLANPSELQQQLTDGKIQFALCHGFEFAWMLEKDPRLKPLMIAAPQHRPLKGYIVVASTNSAKDLDDLKGTMVALPNGIHETARMFARWKCECASDVPSDLFAKVTTPVNAETALHEVFDNKVQAAIVDKSGLQCFAERYPARSKRVRILVESEAFPMSVVAIRDGAVAPETLRRFADGMGKAQDNAMGRQFLALMQSSGFESPASHYDDQIGAIIKQYPPPAK